MNEERKPHIHAEAIKAWADGYKIEGRCIFNPDKRWKIREYPLWAEEWEYRIHDPAEVIKSWADRHKIERFYKELNRWEEIEPLWNKYIQFRVYDPLIEVKEAFKRGETIEGRRTKESNWIDYNKSFVEKIDFDEIWEWRVKPKEEFKVGDWIIVIIGDSQYTIGNVHRITNISKHNVIFIDGNAIGEYCIRKATKQEVLNAPNYNGTATISDFPIEVGDKIKNPKCVEKIYVFDTIQRDFIEENMEVYNNFTYINKDKIIEYTPFSWEDRELLRGKWVVHKDFRNEEKIISFIKGTSAWITLSEDGRINPVRLFEDYIFLDGSPCGKLK